MNRHSQFNQLNLKPRKGEAILVNAVILIDSGAGSHSKQQTIYISVLDTRGKVQFSSIFAAYKSNLPTIAIT